MASLPSMAIEPTVASQSCQTPPSTGKSASGRRSSKFSVSFLRQFPLIQGSITGLSDKATVKMDKVVDRSGYLTQDDQVMYRIPLAVLLEIAPWAILVELASAHSVYLVHGTTKENILQAFTAHTCIETCHRQCVVFSGANTNRFKVNPQPKGPHKPSATANTACQAVFHSQRTESTQITHIFDVSSQNDLSTPMSSFASDNKPEVGPSETKNSDPPPSFPPQVLPISKRIEIIREWTERIATEIEEDTCACCAQLVQRCTIQCVPLDSKLLYPLGDPCRPPGTSAKDHLILCPGGVVDNREAKLCETCTKTLKRKTVPRYALANGLSLGEVPSELLELNFVEKLLISKFRHYMSVIRVSKGGQRKLAGNAIIFAQPVAKFYDILPPPRDDLNDCLSIMFTGASRPTYEDFTRTPLLVRRRVVQRALIWLMANHPGYAKVKFSQKNLDSYAEDSPPVDVVFRPQKPDTGNIPSENLPVYATSDNGGTEDGECSFAISGLTGEELDGMSEQEKKLFALKALRDSEPVVAFGRSSKPESIYNNPNLYTGMFPWLFPYGIGGLKNPLIKKELGRAPHIRWYLMYHDRRFQTDPYFPFLVFNHNQVTAAVRGGWLVTEKRHFDNVVERILDLDAATLDQLIKRGQENGYVVAETEEEKKCCRILPLIEHASAGVEGSFTQRKYQRHEIKSVVYEKGLPIFFITFAPVDFKNPICLHYCGRDISISPLAPATEAASDRLRAIASNPVACARFFDVMVRMFIDIVLRDGKNEDGLFGRTSGYYGTVESQGRLTLHLHLLLWIENSDSPQQMRDKALAKEEDFMNALLDWLESCHQGEFSTGSEKEIGERLQQMKKEKRSYSPAEIVNKMKEIERKRELAKAAKREQQENIGATAGIIDPEALSSSTEEVNSSPKVLATPEVVNPTENLRSADSDPLGENLSDEDDDDSESETEDNPMLDPTLSLPPLVPKFTCPEEERDFWLYVLWITDEVVYRSNRHDQKHRYGCWRNETCRARYPRDFVGISTFLEENGALLLKKGEPWINTFSIVLSYLMRCNTDVTCLLSGTQAKAVIAYVTDYITKMALKTHSVFEAVKAVLDKRTDFSTDDKAAAEAARRVLTKVVNVLTSRTEVGGPMLCSLLLGNPDHYTSMKFKVFFWYSYFLPVARLWGFDLKGDLPGKQDVDETEESEDPEHSDRVILKADKDHGILPWSKVNHYIYRPHAFENYSLYDFLRLTDVRKMTPSDKRKLIPDSTPYSAEETESSDEDDNADDGSDNGLVDHDDLKVSQSTVPLPSPFDESEEGEEEEKEEEEKEEEEKEEEEKEEEEKEEEEEEVSHQVDDKHGAVPLLSPLDESKPEEGAEEVFHEVDDQRCYEFQDGHPNKATHAVFKLKGDRSYILNYKGVPLPRRVLDPPPDSDVQERYCIVMLTIFTPWRTGHELKHASESWYQAFQRADLSARAKYVMNNMNLMYECYDASHDFSTQRRKDELKASIPSSISPDAEDCGRGDDVLQGVFGWVDPEFAHEALSVDPDELGDHLIHVLADMEQMKGRITKFFQAGESPPVHEQTQAEIDIVADVRNANHRTSSQWRQEVTKAKEIVLAHRNAALRMPSNLSDSNEISVNPQGSSRVPSTTGNREGNVVVTSIDTLCESDRNDLQLEVTVATKQSDRELMNQVSTQFSLNVDQKRAYELVVDALLKDECPSRQRQSTHKLIEDTIDLGQLALPSAPDPLRLYLGGIGGTGKSQVVKGILSFLENKNESFKCLVLAPTGSAASLVDGSTYHSALSLPVDSAESNSEQRISSVTERFKAVRLIIIDEVSMLSCADLYRISYQLETAFKAVGTTFGARHVVLAGDFGQLPPVGPGAYSLYSSYVPLSSLAVNPQGQNTALGRSLWHTFTTVVILRINMRQRGESERDSAFRTALGNMRYGACTEDDIELLTSRVLGSPSAPTLSDPRFRNVSVITAWNCDRDAINSVSCERFALENGQPLVRFYSKDSWPKPTVNANSSKRRKKKPQPTPVRKRTHLSPADQRFLWEVPPGRSSHTAGTLELCMGMPVLLKYNEATEICATNGAEGTVVGWDSESLSQGHNSLKTLFVQLKSPPRDVQVAGLPKNVVPVATSTGSVRTLVRDGGKHPKAVTRQQVKVLPNFAMTDYCSQGRTRPFNVVDPRNLKGHQSFYTALSRSSSLDGTLLLFPLDARKITRGCAGDLRREYRELEILDDITRMRHEGATDIPQGGHRSYLIQWYRETFGIRHVPSHVHDALDWSSGWDGEGGTSEREYTYREFYDAFHGNVAEDDKKKGRGKRSGGEKAKPRNKPTTKGGKPPAAPSLGSSQQKRGPKDDPLEGSPSKKLKVGPPATALSQSPGPVGLLWDQVNWSCAYDALISILFNTFNQHRERWDFSVRNSSAFLTYLSVGFEHVRVGSRSLEIVRDDIRDILHRRNSVHFPRVGAVLTEISRVCEEIFKTTQPMTNVRSYCSICGNTRTTVGSQSMLWPCPRSIMRHHPTLDANSTSVGVFDLIQAAIRWQAGNHRVCNRCSSPEQSLLSVQSELVWNYAPPLWALEIPPDTEDGFDWLNVNECAQFSFSNGLTYSLIGVVYSGGNHFVCRYRDRDGTFWSHDSAQQQRVMQRNDGLARSLAHVGILQGRLACTWIYMKQ